MKLPQGFFFSQSKLEDYRTCRRRFYWRYIQELPCPAQVAEPAQEFEHLGKIGWLFHQSVRQLLCGIPPEQVKAFIKDEQVLHWLEQFERHMYPMVAPMDWEGKCVVYAPEILVALRIGEFPLVAKFDFLMITTEGRAQIWDWKTSPALPAYHQLEARLQSIVYPLVLAQGGHKAKTAPEKIQMMYWFANFPSEIMSIAYNEDRMRRDWELISQMIVEIANSPEEHFIMTEDERKCRACVYRSLCARGERAGHLTEELFDLDDEGWVAELDFEQILETGF